MATTMTTDASPAGARSASRDRLLVIDDDGGFRNFVHRVGETAGFETFVTGDATAFKDQLRGWTPSVIAIDLNMPGTDGVELLREIAEAKSAARILIMSGADAKLLSAVEKLAAERGLNVAGTLAKPIRAALLKESLERLREFEQPLIESALAHAIATDELQLEFQPKLDLDAGRILGVEALVRWQHRTRGLIPPDAFIPLAERSNLIHDLTRWVFQAALRQAAAWERNNLALDLAINLSAHDLRQLDLPDWMAAACRAEGLLPDSVTLELTESAAMGDPAQSMDVLTRLRIKGFHLSIDDFGTGYSSLIQLRQLPFTEMKIDKSFVMQMHQSGDCRVIVEAVVGLGHKLGLGIVAEGVESAAALEALRVMGVDVAQGYFISRPVGAARIPAAIASSPSVAANRAAS